MRWDAFVEAAPELANLGLEGFREQNLCLVGTIRADGWPRISACEVYVVDGDLLLGMMRASKKAADLERDPRLTVMTPQCDREAKRGDFKIYGRGLPITDPQRRRSFADTLFEAIQWRPVDPYPLYAVDVESASYISFGDTHRLLRWTPDRGLEPLPHPDDVDTRRGVEAAPPSER
jgi:Pyridoxamine 5'-phosphate oxidase